MPFMSLLINDGIQYGFPFDCARYLNLELAFMLRFIHPTSDQDLKA